MRFKTDRNTKKGVMMMPLRGLANIFVLLMVFAIACSAIVNNKSGVNNDPMSMATIPITNQWNGEYPVTQLDRLPEGQRNTPAGYIDDPAIFRAAWQALKFTEVPPEIDFDHHMVIFVRNVTFFNRLRIFKVSLTDGIADIMAMETRSALPIEDKVAMALAAIPKKGIRAIRSGNLLVPVRSDPRNISYRIEGQAVDLIDGRSEKAATSGSASKITTAVLGNFAVGDLTDDSRPDTALILFQHTGGTGTFIYAAAAINRKDRYSGTNAVMIGDRIAIDHISIRNGVMVVKYRDRRPDEPMSAKPTVDRTAYFIVQNGELEAVGTPQAPYHVFEGWVTVGHEVRAFRPCDSKKDLWITGDSTSYKDVTGAHRRHAAGSKPYTPVFMVLYGQIVAAPQDGFGADYPGGFFVSQLIRVTPYGNCKADRIVVDAPTPESTVVSPLIVSGRARGTWFFEGDFPMVIIDAGGRIIGQSYCTAQSPWMTKEFVEFKGEITFEKPASNAETVLLLKKDNPTGKPEHDDALEIPLRIH